MDKFKINFDKAACINCSACISVCDNWVMDDNKAKPKKTTLSEKEFKSNKEAEDICPVNAIKIEG
jgi:ferredoxin